MSLSYKKFFQQQNNDKVTIFKKMFLKNKFSDTHMYDYICSFIFFNQEEIFEIYCASLTNVVYDIKNIKHYIDYYDGKVKICIYANYPGVHIQTQAVYCRKCGELIMSATDSTNRCTCL